MTRLEAGCKINLGLRVRGLRADGYHELESIFLPLPRPRDIIEIEERGRDSISAVFSGADIDPKKNTLITAYRLFAGACGGAPGVSVHVRKGIPYGAGLGGGSSDAAALLRWLHRRAGGGMPAAELDRIAAAVGADVPFFLRSGPCLVTGAGERITPLEIVDFRAVIVLVCPDVHVSTKWAFDRFDALAAQAKKSGDHQNLTSDIDGDKAFLRFRSAGGGRAGQPDLGLLAVHNDLEAAVFPAFPMLAGIREALGAAGAIMSSMSGSGSAIYGIFRVADRHRAETAAKRLSGGSGRTFLLEVPA